jgi:hypothetical protein
MEVLLFIALAFPLGWLALICRLALLAILMLAGALRGVGAIKASVGQSWPRVARDQVRPNPLERTVHFSASVFFNTAGGADDSAVQNLHPEPEREQAQIGIYQCQLRVLNDRKPRRLCV